MVSTLTREAEPVIRLRGSVGSDWMATRLDSAVPAGRAIVGTALRATPFDFSISKAGGEHRVPSSTVLPAQALTDTMADDSSRAPTLAMNGSTNEQEPSAVKSVASTENEKLSNEMVPKSEAVGVPAHGKDELPSKDGDPDSKYVTGKKLAIIFTYVFSGGRFQPAAC